MKEKRKSKTLSIKDLTSEFYKEDNLKKGIQKTSLLKTWGEITNEKTLQRTENIYFKEEKLFIKITSAPLKNELNNNNKKYLFEIQKTHKYVKEIVFY